MKIASQDPGRALVASADSWEWADRAACRGKPLGLFYGLPNERAEHRQIREERALQVCATCPLATKNACLEAALEPTPSGQYGVRGGHTAQERVAILRKRQRAKEPPKKQVSTKHTGNSKPTGPLVDATGTRRRLQALAVLGYGSNQVVARMRCGSPTYLSAVRQGDKQVVPEQLAREVARVYRMLSKASRPPRHATLAHKVRTAGWVGPHAWAGVDIDDPDTAPRQFEGRAA